MSDYKRFTEKRNGENVIPLLDSVCGVDLPKWIIGEESEIRRYLYGDAVNRFAELEDKIENGTLIELPCKVEDKVYQTDGVRIYQGKIGEISFTKEHMIFAADIVCFDERAIGTSVFLTREEAEKKLKELQGNDR